MDKAFDELLDKEQDYPFAYFVVCIGFLVVLIIEHMVLSFEKDKQKVEINEESCRCETIVRSGLPGIVDIMSVFLLKMYLSVLSNFCIVLLDVDTFKHLLDYCTYYIVHKQIYWI